TEGKTRTDMHRQAALQVGQCECLLTIAAVGRADQIEQSIILGDRYERPVAERPADRGKVAGKHTDLADKGAAHDLCSCLCHVRMMAENSGTAGREAFAIGQTFAPFVPRELRCMQTSVASLLLGRNTAAWRMMARCGSLSRVL